MFKDPDEMFCQRVKPCDNSVLGIASFLKLRLKLLQYRCALSIICT